MEEPYTYYRVPNDGAPMRCYVCGNTQLASPNSPNPLIKIAGMFGVRHLQCVYQLNQLREVPTPML